MGSQMPQASNRLRDPRSTYRPGREAGGVNPNLEDPGMGYEEEGQGFIGGMPGQMPYDQDTNMPGIGDSPPGFISKLAGGGNPQEFGIQGLGTPGQLPLAEGGRSDFGTMDKAKANVAAVKAANAKKAQAPKPIAPKPATPAPVDPREAKRARRRKIRAQRHKKRQRLSMQ